MISFGDNVRVLSNTLSEELGIAGLQGQVYGETKPSVSGVEVVGELASDYAMNVYFQQRKEGFWVPPEWLELVDHAPGTEVTLDGVQGSFVRQADGQWKRVGKPWWKFG